MKETNERKTKVIIEKEKFVKITNFNEKENQKKCSRLKKMTVQILRKFCACIKIIPVLHLKISYTHSVDSTVGVVGIIINMQFVRIVVIINSENNGCTKI